MLGEIGPNHTTSTDPSAKTGWRIVDPVTRLREWGSEHAYDLPATPTELTLGSAQSCGLQLVDPSTHTSREHAKLVPFAGGWKIVDLESKNGLWRDGARRLEFVLTPGVEIGIGDLCFIAESAQLIALRALVCRYIGWSAWRQRDVDEALRSLRDWAARRVSLVLMGGGDLFTVARRLHAATLRGGAFVASDEQRDGMTALRSAANGTLWVPELPPDFADVAASLREVGSRTRLMLHAQSAEDAARAAITLARPAIIVLPSLTSRHAEMTRLIQEHADVAAERLQTSTPTLMRSDLDALAALDYRGGFAELDATLFRVVALRTWGLTGGAKRIGISHVALMRWARRRNLAT